MASLRANSLRRYQPVYKFLGCVLLLTIKDQATRVQISRHRRRASMRYWLGGRIEVLIPPPAHFVDLLPAAIQRLEPLWRRCRDWLTHRARSRAPRCRRGHLVILMGTERVRASYQWATTRRRVSLSFYLAAGPSHAACAKRLLDEYIQPYDSPRPREG